ncbi:MAG: phage antirepressor [Acutalibacteraceae bacterium]
MNNLEVFKNEEFGEVRTITIDDEPYFVGKDVALILGYTNPQKALRDHVDEEDKTRNESFTVNGTQGILINESGLYSLILSSKLPNARRFKRWVTSEVLPAIRKHGMYAIDDLIANPDWGIAAFNALKEERERNKKLEESVAVKTQQITEMIPKASYYDVVLNCKDLVSISTISKDYGWSAKKMNKYLHEKGIQFKQGDIWLLYQKYSEKGYTSTKTHTYLDSDGQHTKVHTYWTQKGRLFIYDLLKEDNIYPNIERMD